MKEKNNKTNKQTNKGKAKAKQNIKQKHTHTILTPSCLRPQFPGSQLGTPGTMTPPLATKYDDKEEPFVF